MLSFTRLVAGHAHLTLLSSSSPGEQVGKSRGSDTVTTVVGWVPSWVFREPGLLIAVAVLVASLNVPLLRWPLYPLRLLETWAHELSHGLMALAVGGRVRTLRIFRDGSGLAFTTTPNERWRRFLVLSAGYPGAALLGAILLALRHVDAPGQVLSCLGGAMAVTVVLWVRNLFGGVSLGLLGASLVAAGNLFSVLGARTLLALVGATISLNALTAIRQLYGNLWGMVDGQPHWSDAATVSRLVGLPAWFWATGWLALSVILLKIGLEHPL